MSANEIKIVIKAANQKIDDHIIFGCKSWSVGHLKSQISISYPSKPKIDEQRLIYSGHLLTNEQLIESICDNDETTMTIHMVCNQKASSMNNNNNNNNNSQKIENKVINENSFNGNDNSTLPDNNFNNFNPETFMNNFQLFDGNFNNNSSINNNNNNNPLMYNEHMFQQMALMQQMYIQCMTQYFNQSGLNMENPFQVPVQINPETTNQTLTEVANGNNNAPAGPPAADAAVGDNNVENIENRNNRPLAGLNAGAAAALAGGDEDFRNHDWLDWFYWITRSFVFMALIYLYSSLSRFILVTAAAMLIYLYQNRLLYPNNNDRRRRNENVNNMNEEQLQQAMDGQVEPNTRQIRNADNNNNTTNERDHSRLKVAWIMITSLFTSLLPQPPEAVNLN